MLKGMDGMEEDRGGLDEDLGELGDREGTARGPIL